LWSFQRPVVISPKASAISIFTVMVNMILIIARIVVAGGLVALVDHCSPGLLVDPGFERTAAATQYLKEIK
jgi:hypothetical protein